MSQITFKQFTSLVDMPDEDFSRLQEGLSDVPGFGWLKSRDNKMKLAKIDLERKKLQNKRDQKSKELDAKWAAMKADLEGDKKPDPKGKVSDMDWDQALSSTDRKFHAKMDKMKSGMKPSY